MDPLDPVQPSLTYLALQQIKERSRRANPEDKGSHPLDATVQSMKDVPLLIAEVERLQAQNQRLVDHSVEMGRELRVLNELCETVQYAMEEAEVGFDAEERYALSKKDGDMINAILDKLEAILEDGEE